MSDVFGYSQPADYKFSHDSIELAQRARDLVMGSQCRGNRDISSPSPLRILDLCAGCGVIGLELGKMLKKTSPQISIAIDFLELQSVYREHFERNRLAAVDLFEARWLEMNYAALLDSESAKGQYDLVISNPPYFDRQQGSLPPSDFKARCRFFVDSDFETMWKTITHVLKPSAQALVLVRDLRDHGVDRLRSLDPVLSDDGSWRELEPIRGTGLIHFQKLASRALRQ